MIYIVLMLNQTFLSGINPTLLWCIILFIYGLILFESILLLNFATLFMIDLSFFKCPFQVLASGLFSSHKINWGKVFILLFSGRILVFTGRICVELTQLITKYLIELIGIASGPEVCFVGRFVVFLTIVLIF